MPDPLAIDDVAHLHSRSQLAMLALRTENRDLRLRQIFQNHRGHVPERTRVIILQQEDRVVRSDFLHFGLQGSRNVPGSLIGNDGDAFLWFELEAHPDRVARAGRKLSINRVYSAPVRHWEDESFTPET